MVLQVFLRVLLLFLLPRLPCYGLEVSVPWKTPKNSTDTHRLLLVISLSGLNADDPDIFSMPNLLHLRSHSSYPSFFVPQFPGTAAPSLFSMATGLYPENHGVLANKIYDPKRGKMLTEKDPGYFTQNPLNIPIWTLNEINHGVSACIMWPGCEVAVAGHKPTFYVPHNDSYSFTDLVDLVLSFASAKFPEEDYVKYVAGRAFAPAAVMKSAMVKSKDVEGLNETKNGGIGMGETKITKDVEHGDKKTEDEEIMVAAEQGGKKTGEEEIVQVVVHSDEKIIKAVEHSDKNPGDEETTMTKAHSDMSTEGEEVMTMEHSGKKTHDEEMMVAEEHSDEKTTDEGIFEAVEHVGTETIDEKMMDATNHDDQKTGDDEMDALEHSNSKTDDGEIVEDVENGEKKMGEEGVMVVVENAENETDQEIAHGLEHNSNETATRSRRDVHREYGRFKRQDSWTHHYMATDWKQRYSSESEEKYQVVRVATEETNNRIKHIIDAHDKTAANDQYRSPHETFEEAANRSSNDNQNFTWHPYPFFKNLARSRVMYTLEPKARANLVMFRFDEPAKTARRFGPHSPQMMAALHTLDTGLLYLHLQLQRHHLQHNTDVILVSDQGTIPLGFKPSPTPPPRHRSSGSLRNKSSKDDVDSKKFFINLDAILDPSLYQTSGETPLLHVWPKPRKYAEVHNRLTNASAKHHFSVYGPENLSYDAYHSSTNPRISKILLVADLGYAFSDKMADQALAGPWQRNISEAMPLMLAAGPSFRENFEGFTMQAVDLYPLMMEVLDIHNSPPVNGSFVLPSFMLKTVPLVIYNASWIFAVMAVIILVLVASLLSCCLRQTKEPVSPAPQRMSTIYRSTVEADNSLVEYDVRVMPTIRGNRSRSTSADCVDVARSTFTPARVGKGKAPPIPCQHGEEGEGEEIRDEPTDEYTKLLLKKASSENVK